MVKKHPVLIGILISSVLLLLAASFYPGGSQFDPNAIGFDWKNNYLCNLFGEKAVNGADNPARFWAIAGMVFLCISFALFFVGFSRKIGDKSASKIIRYFGVSGMAAAFFVVTPLHDSMVILTSTLGLLSMFYIAVFVFRSRLHFLKVLSAGCLLMIYSCNFMYYTQNYLEWLPIVQKISLGLIVLWILGLEYFAKAADFQGIK